MLNSLSAASFPVVFVWFERKRTGCNKKQSFHYKVYLIKQKYDNYIIKIIFNNLQKIFVQFLEKSQILNKILNLIFIDKWYYLIGFSDHSVTFFI